MGPRACMNRLRLALALSLSALYAVAVVYGMATGRFELATAMTPVATMAVAFVLGVEFLRALRRKDNGE